MVRERWSLSAAGLPPSVIDTIYRMSKPLPLVHFIVISGESLKSGAG